MDPLGKGMIHIPSGMEWDSVRFHHRIASNLKYMNCLFLELSI